MPGSPRHFLSKVILDLFSYVILEHKRAPPLRHPLAQACPPLMSSSTERSDGGDPEQKSLVVLAIVAPRSYWCASTPSRLSAFVYGICCANSYTCASIMLVCKHPITTLGFLYMESAAQIHNWRLGYEQASLLTTLGFLYIVGVWKMIL